jgi:predicted phage terminase large subunit-like protein
VLETKDVLGSHFSSIYQQKPEEKKGNIFRRGDWKRFTTLPAGKKRVVQSWDTGFKTGEENSYSACTTWVETEKGYYLVHAWWERVTFPELKRSAVELCERYKPDEVLIEDKASGQSLLQELSETTKMPIKPVKPSADKIARAHAVTPVFESGNVYIPEGELWADEVIEHAARFPRTKNTDVIDSVTQAIEYMRHGRSFMYSYHGGAYARAGGRKSIFEMEREKRNG